MKKIKIIIIYLIIINTYLIMDNIDYIQNESFKILFIHVPEAWISLIIYILIGIIEIWNIIKPNPKKDIISISLGEIGIIHLINTIITGSLWGKISWGVYWVWDGRMTSYLILLIIGILYIKMKYIKKIYGSYIAIIALLNIPIIKYSVEWWTTLHQKSSITIKNTSLDEYNILILMISFIIIILITYILTTYRYYYHLNKISAG